MSVNLILAIRDARELSSSEKSVLYSLAARCRPGVAKCWPAVPTIAGDAGMHERTVQRVLKELSKKRWITIKLKKLGATDRNSTSDYILHPPPISSRWIRGSDENTINSNHDDGIMPPTSGNTPPISGAMSPEVSIEVTKEVTKTILSTGKEPLSYKTKEMSDSENLIQWFKSIGVSAVELQALKRDKSTGRGITGQSIDAADWANKDIVPDIAISICIANID